MKTLPWIPILLGALLTLGAPAPAWAVFGDDDDDGGTQILDDIVIAGNTRTDETLILREMDLTVGQPFAYEDMDRVWDHLEDLGLFAFVDMERDDSEDGKVTLLVTVEEDMTTSYSVHARYSRRHKYELGAWLEEKNLRGKGERVRIEAVAIYPQRAALSWIRPWFLGVRGLEATLDAHALQSAFVFRPTRFRSLDGGFALRWEFTGPFFVGAGVNYGQNHYRDSYTFPAPGRGADTPDGHVAYPSLVENRTAVSASVGLDTRSNIWYPAKGYYVDFTARSWSSPVFDTYLETNLDLRAFLPVPGVEHVLALRAYGRDTDGPAHLNNVLFYGGPETIRGYPFGQLEGDKGYLLTVEYRLPLFLMPISPQGEMVGFGLHAFADAGDAWYDGAESGRAQQSYGAGAHFNIDRLQLRFEAARTREGDWAFEFMDQFNF